MDRHKQLLAELVESDHYALLRKLASDKISGLMQQALTPSDSEWGLVVRETYAAQATIVNQFFQEIENKASLTSTKSDVDAGIGSIY